MLDSATLLDLYQQGRAADALTRAGLLGRAAAGAPAGGVPGQVVVAAAGVPAVGGARVAVSHLGTRAGWARGVS